LSEETILEQGKVVLTFLPRPKSILIDFLDLKCRLLKENERCSLKRITKHKAKRMIADEDREGNKRDITLVQESGLF
jgi:hypothetical protein